MKPAIAIGLLSVAATAAIAACSNPLGPSGCAGVGYHALRITITDQYGDGQALGATVTLTDGSYQERDGSEFDPVTVWAAGERGGRTYDIRVSKPYYKDVVINGVKTRGGGCVTGHEDPPVTITVPVTLTLAQGAPPIRSLHLVPHHILLDRTYTESFAFRPYVDANPGVSRAVSWTLRGDTASVTFDAASGTLRYRCLPKSGFLWITARSLVDPKLVDSADVAVQGHPAATNDPACS
jgi:hypothetical protein